MTRPTDNLADRDDLAKQIVDALERRRRNTKPGADTPRVVPALVLAEAFSIRQGASDDSRKRGVREVIKRLRADGVPVLADRRGYYHAGQRSRSQGLPSIPATQRSGSPGRCCR